MPPNSEEIVSTPRSIADERMRVFADKHIDHSHRKAFTKILSQVKSDLKFLSQVNSSVGTRASVALHKVDEMPIEKTSFGQLLIALFKVIAQAVHSHYDVDPQFVGNAVSLLRETRYYTGEDQVNNYREACVAVKELVSSLREIASPELLNALHECVVTIGDVGKELVQQEMDAALEAIRLSLAHKAQLETIFETAQAIHDGRISYDAGMNSMVDDEQRNMLIQKMKEIASLAEEED